MRIAWFSPLPPVQSGIADYSAELLPRLAARHATDVFVATPAEGSSALDGVAIRPAHDFSWATHRAPYDLVVFQLGNAACHEYTWPYLFRYPGLVVLHDAHLHQARAQALLRRNRRTEYRAELAFSHPAADPGAAEIGLAGLGGPLSYLWPMLRPAVAAARMVAVHNAFLGDELRRAHPDTPIEIVRMGVADPKPRDGREWIRLGRAARARYGIPPDAVVLASYGGLTPEKRLTPVFRAVAAIRRGFPAIRLLLVGRTAPYYDLPAEARRAGIADLVVATGYVPDADLPACLAAADVALCLRWPTARETSASWLRCLAAGLPTVTTDLVHEAARPSLDPRSWTVAHGLPRVRPPDPIGVSIDILDEEHSLRLALARLVEDRDLRLSLGVAARRAWEADHRLEHMHADYERVLAAAAAAPRPAAVLPPHLRVDGLELAREILAPFGPGLAEWLEQPRRSGARGPDARDGG